MKSVDLEKDALVNDGKAWQKIGEYPGPVMYVLGFMRVERIPHGFGKKWRFRAWDVLRVPAVRRQYPTTIHKTLEQAKAHCEQIVQREQGEGITA